MDLLVEFLKLPHYIGNIWCICINAQPFCLILMKTDSQLHICMRLQLCVGVQVGEERRTVQIQVCEDAPVITVIFRTSNQVGLAVTVHSTLFEVSEHLSMGKDINTCVYFYHTVLIKPYMYVFDNGTSKDFFQGIALFCSQKITWGFKTGRKYV